MTNEETAAVRWLTLVAQFGRRTEITKEQAAAICASLAAVTAERDQARAYLDGAEGQLRIRSDEAYEQRVRAMRAESLLDQARQMLADAPHEESCVANVWTDDEQPFDARPCDCWKAGL